MFKCELNEYKKLNEFYTYDFLYNNLVPKEDTKKPTTTNPIKRGDIITQMLMDNLNLELNKDKRFEKDRYLYYYEVSYFKIEEKEQFKEKEKSKEKTIIKEKKYLKRGSSQIEFFEVNGINYTIKFEKLDVQVSRPFLESEGAEAKIAAENNEYVKKISSTKSDKKYSTSEKDLSSSSQDQEKNTTFYKNIIDTIDKKKYLLSVMYTNCEVDGNVVTKEAVNVINILGDILYYPKTEDVTKIEKGAKILIEVKQNPSLSIIFEQMKKTVNKIKILLPNEKYYYFGFLNDVKAKNEVDENEFIKKVQDYEKQNGDFKIFLFLIKNNTIFDLELSDKAEYSVFFRNELKKEINQLKNEVTGIKNEITGIMKEITGIKNEITGIKNEIDGIKVNMDNKINELKNELKNEIKNQYSSLSDMIKNIMDKLKSQEPNNNSQ